MRKVVKQHRRGDNEPYSPINLTAVDSHCAKDTMRFYTALLLMLCLAACGAWPLPGSTPAAATRTPLPTAEAGVRYTVTGPAPANARVEPVTIGPIRATFQPGDSVTVVATIVGQTVGGSNQWHVIEFEGRRLYMHSALLQPESPLATDAADAPS